MTSNICVTDMKKKKKKKRISNYIHWNIFLITACLMPEWVEEKKGVFLIVLFKITLALFSLDLFLYLFRNVCIMINTVWRWNRFICTIFILLCFCFKTFFFGIKIFDFLFIVRCWLPST